MRTKIDMMPVKIVTQSFSFEIPPNVDRTLAEESTLSAKSGSASGMKELKYEVQESYDLS